MRTSKASRPTHISGASRPTRIYGASTQTAVYRGFELEHSLRTAYQASFSENFRYICSIEPLELSSVFTLLNHGFGSRERDALVNASHVEGQVRVVSGNDVQLYSKTIPELLSKTYKFDFEICTILHSLKKGFFSLSA